MAMVTIRQFVRDYRQGLAQASGNHALQLGKGQCADFNEYKRKVGFIAGLEAAGEMADSMLRQIEDMELEGQQAPPQKKAGGKK